MGDKSTIEWTDATWNPWRGCHKVSQGCKHCYMFREQRMYGADPNVVMRSKTTFEAPLKWKDPKMIFTCSWSDFFIEEADVWRDEAWEIIRQTPQHTYQILTKRPERIRDCLPAATCQGDWFPRNVWWGVSIESQEHIQRWSILDSALHYHIPAVMFISAEPLLGPLDLFGEMQEIDVGDEEHNWWTRTPDWIIVGGESGPDYRSMDLEWARSILAQCREYEVACFVKQLGGWPNKRTDLSEWPEDLRVREWPE